MGHQLGTVSSFQTNKDIDVLIPDLARRIKQVLADYKEIGACEGVALSYLAWLTWQVAYCTHRRSAGAMSTLGIR
jgi:hypothetical protein